MRRQHFLFMGMGAGLAILLAGAGLATNCARPQHASGADAMAPTSDDAAALRARYEQDPRKTFESQWTLSWWRHGGEPGPDWLSDKIDITAAKGKVTGVYTRARNAPTPPFKTQADEFTGQVPSALAEPVFRAIVAGRLYERTLPSESRADLADAVQHAFELNVGSLRLVKTLHEPSRDELGELGPALEGVANHLRDTGAHRDVTRP
ncbi:hypothetical protein WME91_23285 [Sorangium sp. So ce269]